MDSKQLYQALMSHKLTRKIFDGIYSRDTLKDIVKRPKFIICNTDPSHKPGKHWVAFYFYGKNYVFFFDSLGKSISHYGREFVNFVKRYSKKMTFSKRRVQPPKTDICGHYCLFCGLCIVQKYKPKRIIQSMLSIYSKTVVKIVRTNFYYCSNSTQKSSMFLQCCKKCH